MGSLQFDTGLVFDGVTVDYNLSKSFSEDNLSFTGDTLTLSSRNITCFDSAFLELDTWTTSYLNFSVDNPVNCTICNVVSTNYYSVYQGGLIVTNDIKPDSNTCINFNVSSVGYTIVNVSQGITYSVVEYSMYNGSYNYGMNQSLEFYCFPVHNNCTPRWQTNIQWSFNYTNVELGSVSIGLRVNESVQGYTPMASVTNESGDATEITTSSATLTSVAVDEQINLWVWINTFYPFRDFNSIFIMETT